VGEAPGVDLRGDGGYVVAAPSAHVSGQRYRWDDNVLPRGLRSWAQNRPAPAAAQRSVEVQRGRQTRYAQAALEGEAQAVQRAPEGTRNATLNRAAFKLGTLVGAGLLDEATVWTTLADAGEAVGLGAREVSASVHSGLTAGAGNPRQLGAASQPPSPHQQAVRQAHLEPSAARLPLLLGQNTPAVRPLPELDACPLPAKQHRRPWVADSSTCQRPHVTATCQAIALTQVELSYIVKGNLRSDASRNLLPAEDPGGTLRLSRTWSLLLGGNRLDGSMTDVGVGRHGQRVRAPACVTRASGVAAPSRWR
jgi:hypothetical protein